LESIVSQATDEVEIVVLDGASTDNTEEVVRLYQDRFPHLVYVRQENNMGIDRDFSNAVDLAHGEYCWFFCDDDLIKPGGIATVLAALQQPYSLVIANSEVRNADLSKVLQRKSLSVDEDRVYRSNECDLLLRDAGSYLSFIGCVIIERKLWLAREKETYFGSYFIHVGVIFQEPLPGDALVIAEPVVSLRYGNASWLGKYFQIWMFKWPELIWSFKHLSEAAKNLVYPEFPWRSPAKLLLFRANGAYTKTEYTQWVKPRLNTYWTRLASRLIANFPGRLSNLLAFIYYFFFRRPSSRLLILLDLSNSPFCFWRLPARGRQAAKPQSASVSRAPRLPSNSGTRSNSSLDI
jgi:abequosyltransferase